MKKTLVIHPIDKTTDILSKIYKDKGFTVLREYSYIRAKLVDEIEAHDRIIMLGHGLPDGLLDGTFRLVIDETYAELLRTKECVCVWCYANFFVKEHNLKGFNTGMFVSEYKEATVLKLCGTIKEIDESAELFSKLLGEHLDSPNRLELIKEGYKDINDITKYNRNRLYDYRN